MEAYIRRTGDVGSEQSEAYELSYLLDLRHLGDLTKSYLAVYGEELTDEKLHTLVIDLIYGFMTNVRCSHSHRWMGKFFNEGMEFIELFEKETSKALSSAINIWREYEPESIHIQIDKHLASTFIGFKRMIPNVNRTLLPTQNGLDTYIGQRIVPLFEQDVVMDFSNSMTYQVCEQELMALASGRITWAYLIEECMRINGELRKALYNPSQISVETVIEHIDIDELRTRFENSEVMERCLLIHDVRASDDILDNIVIDLAGLIARILHSNTEIMAVITDQLFLRLQASGYAGRVSFHCISFEWLNRAGVAKFGAFPIALDSPIR